MKKLLVCLMLISIAAMFTAASAADMSYQEIVDMAYALEQNTYTTDTYCLYGKIIRVDTAWSSKYQNITVTIAVEGREHMPIECYRLTGPGAADLKVGDTITVKGVLKNYKGLIEFDKGCVLLSVHSKVLPGDADSDGRVTPNDALLLLQHAAGWPVNPDTVNADISGDGSINVNDALKVLAQLAAQ